MKKQVITVVALAGMLAWGINAQAISITSGGSGNWTNTATWNPAQVPTSSDAVVILTNHTITISDTNTHDANSLTIENGGVLTHTGNGGTEQYKVILNISGGLTIDSGGTIDVTGKGYGSGSGPGSPGGGIDAGGTHGGVGGRENAPLTTYGSITNPTSLGSGGGDYPGGGAVIITAAGAVTNNGSIRADGQGGGDDGCGAGGTVSISALTLSGSGIISADGGDDGIGRGAGGGGRIAIVLSGGAGIGGITNTAYGGLGFVGANPRPTGAAGTVYLNTTADTNGRLIVDNNGQSPWKVYTTTRVRSGSYQFDSITTENYGILELVDTAVFDLTGTTLSSDSAAGNVTSRIIFDEQSHLSFPAAYSLAGVLSQKGTNAIAYTLNLTVATNGILMREAGGDDVLNLTLNGSLTVDIGGLVGGIGLGYGSNSGPGAPSGGDAGGAHGGKGGRENATDNTYGLILTPDTAGSGGAGNSGGGVVLLDINGAVTNNGTIQADGRAGNHGCGAGGSIALSATTLAGSGTISANGGTDTFGRGSGGGGRVAINLSTGNDVGGNTVEARGGADPHGTHGGAGTYYLERATDGAGAGRIFINNLGAGNNTMHLPGTLSTNAAALNELIGATVVLTNQATVHATTNATIADILIYSGCTLTLSSYTLTVDEFEHDLEDASIPGPGNTNRVDNYSQIIWKQPPTPPSGTVILIR